MLGWEDSILLLKKNEPEVRRGSKGGDLLDSSAMSSSKKGLRCMREGKGLVGEMGVEEEEGQEVKGLV